MQKIFYYNITGFYGSLNLQTFDVLHGAEKQAFGDFAFGAGGNKRATASGDGDGAGEGAHWVCEFGEGVLFAAFAGVAGDGDGWGGGAGQGRV